MALSEKRKAALLAYCRLTELEGDEEVEAVIPVLYEAAVGYMEEAGVTAPEPDSQRAAQYDLCVNALVLDWWDHRDLKEPGSQASENPAFRRLINQLKFSESPAS